MNFVAGPSTILLSLLISSVYCCTSRTSRASINHDPQSIGTSPVVRGRNQLTGLGNIQLETPLSSSSAGQITRQEELSCFDFTKNCRWRNVQGYDQMEWWRGIGKPDPNLLRQGTGTTVQPRSPYGIVATNRASKPDTGAIMASDPILCQIGNGEIRFKYWTSPGVQLRLCLKALNRQFPNYDYCTRIPAGGPGPAFVSIPGPINEPFEIFLRADNFVYNGGIVEGGYAVIDDIEYFGELCKFGQALQRRIQETETEFVRRPPPGRSFEFTNNVVQQRRTNRPPDPVAPVTAPSRDSSCQVLDCDFTSGSCLEWSRGSEWNIANGPIGNPLTGIRGDGSRLPYDTTGQYAYAAGPARRLRLQTPPFIISQPMNLMFSYYKASRDTRLQVFVQRNEEQPVSVFSAPDVTAGSRRWFREARQLLPGSYESIIFEASNIGPNAFVGIDEITLSDTNGQIIC